MEETFDLRQKGIDLGKSKEDMMQFSIFLKLLETKRGDKEYAAVKYCDGSQTVLIAIAGSRNKINESGEEYEATRKQTQREHFKELYLALKDFLEDDEAEKTST